MIFTLYLTKFILLIFISFKVFIANDKVYINGFHIIMTFVLFLSRIHLCFYNHELNLDEGQMLSQGITILSDPLVYRSFDPTTGGPINSYFLALFGLFGLSLDYRTAHFAALIILSATLLVMLKFVSLRFEAKKAILIIYPVFLLLTTTNSFDFLHFSSELIVVFLISVVIYLLERGIKTNYFLIGIILPLGILAKLQALPILLSLELIIVMRVIRKVISLKSLLILIFGNLSVIIMFILVLNWQNVLDDFFLFYFLRNLNFHSSSMTLLGIVTSIKTLFFDNVEVIFYSAITFFPFFFFRPIKKFDKLDFYILIEIFIVFVATCYALFRSGSNFYHYLFLFLPFGILASFHFWQGILLNNLLKNILTLLIGGLLFFQFHKSYRYSSANVNFFSSNGYQKDIDPISLEILSKKDSGDRLIVWGWDFKYYINTQLPQGTQLNHFPYLIKPHKYQDIEIERFRSSILKGNAKFIVDAVPSSIVWYRNNNELSLENNSKLSYLIKTKYDLILENQSIKLYLLKIK